MAEVRTYSDCPPLGWSDQDPPKVRGWVHSAIGVFFAIQFRLTFLVPYAFFAIVTRLLWDFGAQRRRHVILPLAIQSGLLGGFLVSLIVTKACLPGIVDVALGTIVSAWLYWHPTRSFNYGVLGWLILDLIYISVRFHMGTTDAVKVFFVQVLFQVATILSALLALKSIPRATDLRPRPWLN